jgi:hypothetical protein
MIDRPYTEYKSHRRDVKTVCRPELHDWRVDKTELDRAVQKLKTTMENRTDLCCSPNNAKANVHEDENKRYNVWNNNFGTKEPLFLNPPFHLLDRITVKILKERPSDMILIIPDWEEKLFLHILRHLPAWWEPLAPSVHLYSYKGVEIGTPRWKSWAIRLTMRQDTDYTQHVINKMQEDKKLSQDDKIRLIDKFKSLLNDDSEPIARQKNNIKQDMNKNTEEKEVELPNETQEKQKGGECRYSPRAEPCPTESPTRTTRRTRGKTPSRLLHTVGTNLDAPP